MIQIDSYDYVTNTFIETTFFETSEKVIEKYWFLETDKELLNGILKGVKS